MNPTLDAIFGSRSATQVLLFLQAYGSGHALRIATTYGVAVSGIQRQLKRLETSDVLVSQLVGKTRVFQFNPHNPTVSKLREFLASELTPAVPVRRRLQDRRKRQQTEPD